MKPWITVSKKMRLNEANYDLRDEKHFFYSESLVFQNLFVI